MGQYSRNGFVVVSVKTKGAHHEQDHQNSILPSGTSNCRRPRPCDSGRPGRPRGRGSRRNLRPRRSGDGGDHSRQYASTASAHGRLRAAARRSRIRHPRSERPVRRHCSDCLFAGPARCLRSATSSASALVLSPSATASSAALASAAPSPAALAPPSATSSAAPCAPASRSASLEIGNKSAQTTKEAESPGFGLLGYSGISLRARVAKTRLGAPDAGNQRPRCLAVAVARANLDDVFLVLRQFRDVEPEALALRLVLRHLRVGW